MQQTTPPAKSIRFTGRSFMAFVLSPMPPIAEWLTEFDAFAARSPGFFAGRPVVVDIAHMPASRPELVHLVTELKRRHITIMGLDGRTPGELGADARGLPPILSGGKEIAVTPPAPEATAEAAVEPDTSTEPPAPEIERDAAVTEAALAAIEEAMATPDPGTLIVSDPIRSGQSIVHLTGDVVVIGSVASGSEVVSSGSIHVYGALRGRAIAGSNGDQSARVFAQSLNAELVAIAGLYKTAEDLDRACLGAPTHAWLDGDALKLSVINGKV